jgi:hypothetical protein
VCGIQTAGRPWWGTEILVEKDGNLLRLMSVHLKSGCHGGSLEPATTPDCITLAAQRAPLEGWIDAAATAQVPFVIVGDWNRRIDVHGQGDHVWGEIDDAARLGPVATTFQPRQQLQFRLHETDRFPGLRRSRLDVR